MTICAGRAGSCRCQPDKGDFCDMPAIAEMQAEITTLRQQLAESEARVTEMMACLGEGLEAWERYFETGGGSPVAHRAFVEQVRSFNAAAKRLRQKADELERKDDNH